MPERNLGGLAVVNQEKTACIRVLLFLFFCSPSVVAMVRSSKIEVFRMAAVGRGYNELECRRVIKTLLDAGVESTRELREEFRVTVRVRACKAPNETRKRLN